MDSIRITVNTVGPAMSTYGPGAFLRIMLALLESRIVHSLLAAYHNWREIDVYDSVHNMSENNTIYKITQTSDNNNRYMSKQLTLYHGIQNECNRNW